MKWYKPYVTCFGLGIIIIVSGPSYCTTNISTPRLIKRKSWDLPLLLFLDLSFLILNTNTYGYVPYSFQIQCNIIAVLHTLPSKEPGQVRVFY